MDPACTRRHGDIDPAPTGPPSTTHKKKEQERAGKEGSKEQVWKRKEGRKMEELGRKEGTGKG